MERRKFERAKAEEAAATRVLQDAELVEAFHHVTNDEQEPTQRRLHLKRDPVWLNDYKWKKGQSGNPGGRPPVVKLSVAVVNRLKEVEPTSGKTYAELIAIALINRAIQGDPTAARQVLEMSEGKLPDTLNLNASIDMQLSQASDEELNFIIESYLEASHGNAENTNNNTYGDGPK